MERIIMSVVLVGALCLLAGCSTDAEVASHNISKSADMFQIDRRIVFYNGITNTYMLAIEGRCSIEPTDKKLMVTCKTSPNTYKKHYLGLSDNVTYFAEQLGDADVSVYRYKVIFKPGIILPDVVISKR